MDRRRNHSADTVEEEWAKSDRRRNLRFASLGGQGFAGGGFWPWAERPRWAEGFLNRYTGKTISFLDGDVLTDEDQKRCMQAAVLWVKGNRKKENTR